MITKHGMGVWSTTPPAQGFRVADVSEQALAETPTAAADSAYQGPAHVIGYTVTYEGDAPSAGIVVAKAETADTHTVAVTSDPALLADMSAAEWVGRRIDVSRRHFSQEDALTAQIVDPRWAPHVEGARQVNDALRQMGDLIPVFTRPSRSPRCASSPRPFGCGNRATAT